VVYVRLNQGGLVDLQELPRLFACLVEVDCSLDLFSWFLEILVCPLIFFALDFHFVSLPP